MAYESLRKLYYGDETVYQQTYFSRFGSDVAIKLDFQIAGKPAFFVQCNEVIAAVYEILRLDKEVGMLRIALPGKAADQYAKKCLIDEIVLTNKIEGVHSSRKEIGEVLDELGEQSRSKGKKKRFDGLVNKYLKLLTHEPVPLRTCEDIRRLYDEIVLDEVVAENPEHAPDGAIFRRDETAVRSATDKIIHSGLYPEREIIAAMERALAFFNDSSIEKLYRICLFHYLLEYIHPFYDGNGRLGRFIVSYCLAEEMEPLLAYRLSETIKENLSVYYKAFETCNDPHNLGDLTPFLLMMLQMIRTSIEELGDSLQRRLTSWKRYEKLTVDFPGATSEKVFALYNVLIQAALFGETGISTKELEDFFSASYGTVRNLLLKVKQTGMLVSTKVGRERYYKLDLSVLDDLLLKQE